MPLHALQCRYDVAAFDNSSHQVRVVSSRALVFVGRHRGFAAPLYARGFTPTLEQQLQLLGLLAPGISETHVRFALLSVQPFAPRLLRGFCPSTCDFCSSLLSASASRPAPCDSLGVPATKYPRGLPPPGHAHAGHTEKGRAPCELRLVPLTQTGFYCCSITPPWQPGAGGARTAGCRRVGSSESPAAYRCAPGPRTRGPRRRRGAPSP